MTVEQSERTRERDRGVRRVLVITGIANAIAVAVKLAVGLTTGSLAVFADALHSVTDVANNIVAYVIMHFASKPPDREHPYGHRKFETLAVFVLATMLTVLAIEIALHALRASERSVSGSGLGLAAMLGVLGLNAVVSLWETHKAHQLDSPLLHADARHTLADVFVMVGVIAGWQFSTRGHPWVDTALTVAVSGVVLFFALGLFRRVVPVLVDRGAHDPDAVRTVAARITGVHAVRTVRSRWVGSETAIDVVVTVDPDLRMTEAHDIADAVEDVLASKFTAAFINVHVEPDDPATAARDAATAARDLPGTRT